MTHVAHPYSQRLGIIRDWKSRWFTRNQEQYRNFIKCDTIVREFLEKRLRGMYVCDIEIERNVKQLRVIIKTSRPGIVIGRSGEGAVKLKQELDRIISKLGFIDNPELKLDVEEVRSPESNASIVGQMVSEGLEKRMPFRRVLKQTVDKVMANRDVEGVRITMAGRLGGADMSRQEEIKRGRVPLQTLRADIDYAQIRAYLPYGVIGIKVWIYKGDVFYEKEGGQRKEASGAQ